MDSLRYRDVFLFVLIGIVILPVLIRLFVSLANLYVKKKRSILFEECCELSRKCQDLGRVLIVQVDTFYRYIEELGLDQIHHCSSSVVSNAQTNKVKYLMKYANIEFDMGCMEKLEFCINFLSLLDIFNSDAKQLSREITTHLPFFVRLFASEEKVPSIVCNLDYRLDKLKNPVFCFLYVSPAGKRQRSVTIVITSKLLREIQREISNKLDKTGHVKAQRSAMTNDLRNAIKRRDNYTCCICGNSVINEPNLLLEVDHIIPVTKGGKTEASNLQTLCWRCNRNKSADYEPNPYA